MAGIIGSEITPTIAAVFIPEHWAKKAQLATRKGQVLAGTVDTQYEKEMSSGQVFHIAHVLNLAVTAKSDNTVVVPDANTPTNQDITIDTYVYSAFNIQSITDVQNAYNLMELYGAQIGYALQGNVEATLAGLPDDLATNTVGTLGIEMTMDDWETAWTKLQVGLAPLNDRSSWLSSAAVSALRKLGTPIDRDYTVSNANALDSATMGQFLGMRIVESQYLEAPATGQHECCAFQKEQFILTRQVSPTVERERIVGDLSTLTVGWELYTADERQIIAEASGSETLTDAWGVWLKTV